MVLTLKYCSNVCSVLKRTKKSKNDLINAEEGEDHFTDISSVGKANARDSNLLINVSAFTLLTAVFCSTQ